MSTGTSVFPVAEPRDERIVEEVHCIECNVPIPSLPGWYATVNVRFTCDSCRQKAGRNLAAALAVPEVEPRTAASGLADGDIDLEPALDEIDDVELDIDDTEPEMEAE